MFTFRSAIGTFTARKERAGNMRGGWYWKAYRKYKGKLFSAYIGKSESVTLAPLYNRCLNVASEIGGARNRSMALARLGEIAYELGNYALAAEQYRGFTPQFASSIWYTTCMKNADNLSIIPFATQQEWEAWLAEHHTTSSGLWLKLAKKETGIPSLSYAEALEGALCYGWIDGQKASFDEQYWLQKFTPRRQKSMWSKVNCNKANELFASGRMRPAGIRQVELAKADGRWEAAYESQSKILVPDDFQKELDTNQKAKEFFTTLNSANRYAILYRIHTAKKAETRSARIQKFIEMLANHQKLHP